MSNENVTLAGGEDEFGGASLETSFEGYKFFKLVTPDRSKGEEITELIVRLLPAMHSYKADRKWKFYYAQHYGHYGNNPRNPEKPRSRPFGCIRKKDRSGNIQTECAKCVQTDKFQAKRKAREAELLKASGLDEKSAEFRALKQNDVELKKLNAWLKKHNTSKKFWINAMDPNGTFGVLQLSYSTCEKILMPLLKKLQGEGIDAFDPNKGVWLRFTRTGSNPNVTDNVEVATEAVEIPGTGRKAMMYREAPMTAEQKQKAVKVCPDLAKDVVKFITAEQIEALVKDGDEPDKVDAIWPQERSAKAAAPDEGEDEGAEDGSGETTTLTSNVPQTTASNPLVVEDKPAPAPVGTAIAIAAPAEPSEEELMKQIEAIRAKRAATATATTSTPAATAPVNAVDARAAFIKSFEPNAK